jgi:hypothetical protein
LLDVGVEGFEAWSVQVRLEGGLPVAECIFEVVKAVQNIAGWCLLIRFGLLVSLWSGLGLLVGLLGDFLRWDLLSLSLWFGLGFRVCFYALGGCPVGIGSAAEASLVRSTLLR